MSQQIALQFNTQIPDLSHFVFELSATPKGINRLTLRRSLSEMDPPEPSRVE